MLPLLFCDIHNIPLIGLIRLLRRQVGWSLLTRRRHLGRSRRNQTHNRDMNGISHRRTPQTIIMLLLRFARAAVRAMPAFLAETVLFFKE